tara:strand:- start:92 stop:406 length:315 start_codon:yes stop_codon:yes gene_type:complete
MGAFMAKRRRGGKADARNFGDEMLERMAQYDNAESLNDNIITPFAAALEKVCSDRGYVLNVYGESSNLVVSNDEDAEAIFQLVEEYFEAREAEEAEGVVEPESK